jgi:hypothetical protein
MTMFENVGVFKLSLPSYLPAYEDGTHRVFRNDGISNSDAGELPRRKHTKYIFFCLICHNISELPVMQLLVLI